MSYDPYDIAQQAFNSSYQAYQNYQPQNPAPQQQYNYQQPDNSNYNSDAMSAFNQAYQSYQDYQQPQPQASIADVAGRQPQQQQNNWWDNIPVVGAVGDWASSVYQGLFPGGVRFNNPFDWGPGVNIFDEANNAAQRFGQGFGAAVAPAGSAIDTVANSDVPVASQVAQGVRGAWEGGVEPLFNFTSSAVGDISKGQVPGVISGVYRSVFDRDQYTKDLTDTKIQAVQKAYNDAIQAGYTEQEAQKFAQDADRKLSNGAQLAEYQGMQRFGELPAIAQLGVQFADPIANMAGDLTLAGRLPKGLTRLDNGLGTAARAVEGVTEKVAPVPLIRNTISEVAQHTGITPLAKGLANKLVSPEQKVNAFDVYSNIVVGDGPNATNLASYARDNGLTFKEAGEAFLSPDSPVYYKNFFQAAPQMGEEMAARVKDVLDYQTLREQTAAQEKTGVQPESTPAIGTGPNSRPLYDSGENAVTLPEAQARIKNAGELYSALKDQSEPVTTSAIPDQSLLKRVGGRPEEAPAIAQDALGQKMLDIVKTGKVDRRQLDFSALEPNRPINGYMDFANKIDGIRAKLSPEMQSAVGLGEKEAAAIKGIIRARAETWAGWNGVSPDDWFKQRLYDVRWDPELEAGSTHGMFTTDRYGLGVINVFKNGDASTFMHEMSHLFYKELGDEARQTVLEAFQADPQARARLADYAKYYQEHAARTGRDINDPAYERQLSNEYFAHAFETYMREGRAPTSALGALFDRFRTWIIQLYQGATNRGRGITASPEVKEIYDSLLGWEPGGTYEHIPVDEGMIKKYQPQLKTQRELEGDQFFKGAAHEITANDKGYVPGDPDSLLSLSKAPDELTPQEQEFTKKANDEFEKLGRDKSGLPFEGKTISPERAKELEYLKPLKLPDMTGADLATGWEAVKKAQSVKAGKTVLIANPITKEMEAHVVPQLYKLGKVGQALRIIGKPVGFLSEVYLKRPGRFVRDALSNIVKYEAEGYQMRGYAARMKQADQLGIQRQYLGGGMGHDIERGPNGPVAKALYFLSDLQTGFANQALRKLSKSAKIQKLFPEWVTKAGEHNDFNLLTENFEAAAKNGVFTTEFLREVNKRSADWLKANRDWYEKAGLPEDLVQKFRDGTISEKMVSDWMTGKSAAQALPEIITEAYHPLNFPDHISNLRDVVEKTKFKPLLQYMDRDLMQSELDEYNKLRFKRQGSRTGPAQSEDFATMSPTSDFWFGIRDNGALVANKGVPIWEGYFTKLDRSLKEMYEAQTATERATLVASQELDHQAEALLNYVNQARALPRLKEQLKLNQQRNEVAYHAHYDTDVVDRAMVRERGKAGPARPQSRITAYYNRLLGPDNILDLPARTHELNHFGSRPREARREFYTNLKQADQLVRSITGNRYKLDYDTMQVVDSKAGLLRDHYLAQKKALPGAAPEPVAAPIPAVFKGKDMHAALEATTKILDEFGIGPEGKRWADMDPLEATQLQSRLAQELTGMDPHNPGIGQAALDHQYRQALDFTTQAKEDMIGRAQKATEANAQRQRQLATNAEAERMRQAAAQKDAETVGKKLMAARMQIVADSNKAAYDHTSKLFFDYRDKNMMDQALGQIFPFMYWSKQNFTYLATHYFTNHPYQFAAILNFYQQLEEENRKQGIPGYARGNILLWTNPDGSKVLWNFSSLFPFTAGDASTPMTVVTPDDSDYANHANKDPLAVLFGFDIKNASGKLTDREKGLVPNILRLNPVFDLPAKMGAFTELYKMLGAEKEPSYFGSAGPSEKQTAGLLPAAAQYKDIAAATGLTANLRKQGVPIADLDIEGPLNSLLFGKTAGKSTSAIEQELAGMAERGEITTAQGMQAVADLKAGRLTPLYLQALDRVEGEAAGRTFLSFIGLSNVVTNTPRSEEASKLYKEVGPLFDALKAAPNAEAKKKAQDALNEWTDKHPGYDILSASNKDTATIEKTVRDQHTSEEWGKLTEQSKNKQITQQQYNDRMNQLKGENPEFFADLAKKDPEKEKQRAADAEYFALNEQRTKLAGDKTDLDKIAADYKAEGNTSAANAIYRSTKYRQAATALTQFDETHPEFAKRREDYLAETYGTKPKTTTATSTGTGTVKSSGSSYTRAASTGSTKSYSTSYRPAAASNTSKTAALRTDTIRAYLGGQQVATSGYRPPTATPVKSSGGSSYQPATSGGATPKPSSSTPFTAKQKKYYAQKLAAGWTKQHAAAAARKITG